MVIESYFSSVTSEDIFRRKFDDENSRPLQQLEYSAASEWGREHLFACRVIRHVRQSDILPSLLKYKPSQETIPPEIKCFLKGPEHGELNQTEHFLIHKYNIIGQIWAALAIFKGNDERRVFDPISTSDEAVVTRPTRVRRITSHGDYVDSGEMEIDSSSPVLQSSPASSLSSYIGTSHNRFKVSEDGTLRLISCVIRYILLYAPRQNSTGLQTVVEFRDVKCKLQATICGQGVTAIDDGGLCLRQVKDGACKVERNRVAILETKSMFGLVNDGRLDIPDDCFAQMTCEALVARKADQNSVIDKDRFVN